MSDLFVNYWGFSLVFQIRRPFKNTESCIKEPQLFCIYNLIAVVFVLKLDNNNASI